MQIRYYLDEETGLPHIWSHGIDEQEVEEIIARPAAILPGRRDAQEALGQTRAGRYLRVVFVPDPEPDSIFVITAYELTGKALKAFRRHRRKRR